MVLGELLLTQSQLRFSVLSLYAALAAPAFALASPTRAPAQPPQPCHLEPADRHWLADGVLAWRYSLSAIAQAEAQQVDAFIFDGGCIVTSRSAMSGGAAYWSGLTHAGLISLPDGKYLPAQVTSFAAPAPSGPFFVMAAPSVWRASGVKDGALPLATLTTAVLLHEGIHVLQLPTYGRSMSRLTARHRLPDSFDDDSIQAQFGANADFAASIDRETKLLFAAAAAPQLAQARELAREARALMRNRQRQWFTGKDAHLREAEEIWLTMEGSGQWLAYRWLTDPNGGSISPVLAMDAFAKRGKWWSQKQGIALLLALERLAAPTWKRAIFGGSSVTAPALIDAALQASSRQDGAVAPTQPPASVKVRSRSVPPVKSERA